MANAAFIGRSAIQRPSAPAEVTSAIRLASAKTGVDFSYLMAKAAQESSFRTDAKASTSSATGLFQFVESTWLDTVKTHGAKHGLGRYADAIQQDNSGRLTVRDPALRAEIMDLRKDAKASALMAAEFAQDNKSFLERQITGDVGATELYLAHFLGAGGASKLLAARETNPDKAAASILPEAARANPSVFYDKGGHARSVDDIYQQFAAKFGETTDVAKTEAPDTPPFLSATPKAKSTFVADSRPVSPYLSPAEPQSLFTVLMLSSLETPLDKERSEAKATKERDMHLSGDWLQT